MSYPQPQAAQEVLDGQNIFRLKTSVESSGDVYEINTSSKGFAIGPESDLSRARITYFDPSQSLRSESLVVSVDNPFDGRIDSRISEKYPVANVGARILVSPDEIINNEIESNLPFGLDHTNGFFSIIKPILDLQCFLGNPSFGPRRRSPRVVRGKIGFDNGASGGNAAASMLLVPCYGRRFASLKVARGYTGAFGSADNQVSLIGLSFLNEATNFGGTDPKAFAVEIVAATNIPHLPTGGVGSQAAVLEYRASTDGHFDYLAIRFTITANVNILVNAAEPNNGLYYDILLADSEEG